MSEFTRIDRGFINLRGDASDKRFTDRISAILGLERVSQPNLTSASEDGNTQLYWLGPDEWLLGTDRSEIGQMLARLESELKGFTAAINVVSGGLVLTTLSGRNASEVLARGCTLDLHPEKFRVGQCAQTTLAKANILLACIDKAPVYEIIVRRSFSEYLLRWLRQTHLSLAGSASSS